MPITTSAKKALRQNKTHRTRNIVKKDTYKKAVINVRKFVAQKKHEEAQKALALAMKALDKAAKTHVIEKNKASRLKSRLAQLIARSTKTSS
jgi:small subunit ribosomal protein S20